MTGASTLPLLPLVILIEILAKLPAKSLARFKCVSKFFYTLITSDLHFANMHRSLSLTLPSKASIIIAIKRQIPSRVCARAFYTINFSKESNGMLQANRVRFLDGETFRKGRLGSSSDGLICQSRSNGDVTICNISTRQHTSLPRIQTANPLVSTCALLGFDSVSKRYKVLMSVKFVNSGHYYKHWVFTLGVDKSWREINSSFYFYPFDSLRSHHSSSSVYIDAVIYSYNSHNIEIVAFEVGAENLSTIPFPDELLERHCFTFGERYYYSDSFVRNSALLEVDGKLAIVLVSKRSPTYLREFYMDIWTLEEAKEWKKLTISIPLELSLLMNDKACLLRFTTNLVGEIMILCIHCKHFTILVYNFRSKVWRAFGVGGIEDFPILFPWKVSLYNIVDNVFSLE